MLIIPLENAENRNFSDEYPIEKKWWDSLKVSYAKSSQKIYKSRKEGLEDLEFALKNSIKSQMLSDMPICSFLSGGKDSSLVTSLIQKYYPGNINTFNISFQDIKSSQTGFDESQNASELSNFLGTNHNEIELSSSEALKIIPQLPKIYSEPFADSSSVATYLVCREAKKSGFTVALSGDGADELFGGYNRHRLIPILEKFGRLPNFMKESLANLFSKYKFNDNYLIKEKKRKLYGALMNSSDIHSIYMYLLSVFSHPKLEILQKDFKYENNNFINFLPDAQSKEEQIMLSDLNHYLPNDILVKLDRAAMANSLETRTPFLDYKVAEVAWSLPIELKIPNNFRNTGKLILNKILEKQIPKKLINKKKKGFAIPLGHWLRGPLKDWAGDLLSKDAIESQGYFDYRNVQDLWNSHQNKEDDHYAKLWVILMWQSWIDANKK